MFHIILVNYIVNSHKTVYEELVNAHYHSHYKISQVTEMGGGQYYSMNLQSYHYFVATRVEVKGRMAAILETVKMPKYNNT